MQTEPTESQIRRLLAKHALPCNSPIECVSREGSVNHVRIAGEFCIRILKEPAFESDLWTESVAVPYLVNARVKTPRLIAFDPSCDSVFGIATIYERAAGFALGETLSVPNLRSIYLDCARQARIWSESICDIDDVDQKLDNPTPIDLPATFARQYSLLDDEQRSIVEPLIDRLLDVPSPPRRFVHWDLHAHNIMVEEGKLTAIIDWGDCGFGDPAINFMCVPAEYLPDCLNEFGDTSREMVASVLRESLGYALNSIHVPDDPAIPLRHTGQKRWHSFLALRESANEGHWKVLLHDKL